MGKDQRTYIAIDLKSFYASVECRERGMDPLDTNLVVADESRTDKTICLAVTPSLKSFGIPGRARLFQVRQKVREANSLRRYKADKKAFAGKSCRYSELRQNKNLELDFLIAPPRMALYMEYSTRIYGIYMKYVSPEDMIVYSVDEVFMDVTDYLGTYRVSPHDLAMRIILDVLKNTGITATAGIGSNLYLCKVAMDVMAKHILADENGVRIAQLDEMSYRRQLWSHRPITDFWRVGAGYAKKLQAYGMFTMGDVARCSEVNEDLLYRLFGKNAELLIDHAWGWEPCLISDVKAYVPSSNSISSGQVLQYAYDAAEAEIVVKEMADSLALDLAAKGLMTDQLVLTVGYDIENLQDTDRRKAYHGEIVVDRYGRKIPKHAHGTINLGGHTASGRKLVSAADELYHRIADKNLLIRRITVVANHVLPEGKISVHEPQVQQLDLFQDNTGQAAEKQRGIDSQKERRLQEAALAIKRRFGKNALMKGMNLQEGATGMNRNRQIGGHRA